MAVVLSQLRLVSSKRLVRKICTLDEHQFRGIVWAMTEFFPALSNRNPARGGVSRRPKPLCKNKYTVCFLKAQ